MDAYGIENLAVFVPCVCAMVAYHLWLVRVVKTNPHTTVYGVNVHGRKAFVAAMIKEKKHCPALQSIRNLIMFTSALATTSVVLLFGFITWLTSIEAKASGDYAFGIKIDVLFSAKVMGMSLILCIAFFCFSQALRFYCHVTLIINIGLPEKPVRAPEEGAHGGVSIEAPKAAHHHHESPTVGQIRHVNQHSDSAAIRDARERQRIKKEKKRKLEETINVDFIADMLNRGAFWNTAGLRCYYGMFPVFCFMWGPWGLLPSTLILLAVFRITDFVGDGMSPMNRMFKHKGEADKNDAVFAPEPKFTEDEMYDD
ncbi:hypothetical protein HDU98_001485 [Podochytrium sp. JEL0797]|nr:hypothetical protein HDU98_001485 [Podochytrium sp. JEL0797]